jgi:hypothetical protein
MPSPIVDEWLKNGPWMEEKVCVVVGTCPSGKLDVRDEKTGST